MKVSLPDPAVLACFDTSASSTSTRAYSQQHRGPTSLLNNPAFVAENIAAPSKQSFSLVTVLSQMCTVLTQQAAPVFGLSCICL